MSEDEQKAFKQWKASLRLKSAEFNVVAYSAWKAAVAWQKAKDLVAAKELNGKLKCGHNPSDIPTCQYCQSLQRIIAATE